MGRNCHPTGAAHMCSTALRSVADVRGKTEVRSLSCWLLTAHFLERSFYRSSISLFWHVRCGWKCVMSFYLYCLVIMNL